MNEASKTRALWSDFERSLLSGSGIDIGSGPDPVTEGVRTFDVEDGDANVITKYVHEQFDFVFSAHCLEHMHDPALSLREWWQLVKPGGHLIFIVPDEDLYEQGYWPSIFNPDHKATFTICKRASWSPRSYNVLELANSLEDAELINIQLQDVNYDRRLLHHARYSRSIGRFIAQTRHSATKRLGKLGVGAKRNFLSNVFRFPIDQTSGDAVAQIQTIVRRKDA